MPVRKGTPSPVKGRRHEGHHKWDIVKDNELLRKMIAMRVEESDLSHEEIEVLAGIPRGYISRYFHAHRLGMSQYHVIKLADVLGLTVSLDIQFKLPTYGTRNKDKEV
jgi:hypothetical protein